MKKHHHTYLFFWWIAGWVFLIAKIVMLFATSYTLYNVYNDTSYADNALVSFSGTQQEENSETTTGSLQTTGDAQEETWVVEMMPEDVFTFSWSELTGTLQSDVVQTWIIQTWTVQTWITQTGGTFQDPYWFVSSFTWECTYSWFSAPLVSGRVYTGMMNIFWGVSPECLDENIDLQLYDHNEEWITLATLSWTTTGYLFDTTLLWSGFYAQTWRNSSWETILLFTGIFSWVASDSWDWYRLRWLVQPDTILSETSSFVIDNKQPSLSWVVLSVSWLSSATVGGGMPVSISFFASEPLTGVSVSIWTGLASFVSLSWSYYTYRYVLPLSLPWWYLKYTISYRDLAGFSQIVTWWSQLFYDAIYPQISLYSLSWYQFSFTTSEPARATSFVLLKNTTNWWAFSMTGLATGHSFSLPTLALNTDYDMGIVVKDIAGNESKAALALKRTSSGNITFTLLATLFGQTLTTYSSWVNFLLTWGFASWQQILAVSWAQNSIKEQFKNEIDKYTECKNNIDYTQIKLQIRWTELILNMPDFKKNEMKKLVNSFILYILKSLEKSPLSDAELESLAKNFDNFSVILKLIKDDNNECKQNLSNYHLDQFKQSLELYGIQL